MAAATTSKLNLVANVPELIALRYSTGKIVESRFGDEQQVYFGLVDGRAAYLSLGVAQKIYALQLGNREEFYICKKSTNKAQRGYVDVWLTPEGEKLRASEETEPEPPSELEHQLAASIQHAQQQRKPAASAQPLPTHGTGTHGPVAMPARAPQQQPTTLQPWGVTLLNQTNSLIDVYAQACLHAESRGVPNAVVRTVMLSAFIGLQRKGGA